MDAPRRHCIVCGKSCVGPGRCLYCTSDGECTHPQYLRQQHAEGARRRLRSGTATVAEITRPDTGRIMTTKFISLDSTSWNGAQLPPGSIVEVQLGDTKPTSPEWVMLPYAGQLELEGGHDLPAAPSGVTEYLARDRDTGQDVRIRVQRGLGTAAVVVEPPEPRRRGRPEGGLDMERIEGAARGFVRWTHSPGLPPPAPPLPAGVSAQGWGADIYGGGRATAEEQRRRIAAWNGSFDQVVAEAREAEQAETDARVAQNRAADLAVDEVRRQRWAEIQRLAAEDDARLTAERQAEAEAETTAAPVAEPPPERSDAPEAPPAPPAISSGLAADLARVLEG